MTVHALKETDTPEKQREIDGSAPAIVIKAARQIGQSLMEMTFAVPLSMTPADINGYVDKVTGVMDRQGYKAELEQEKLALSAAEKNLRTNDDQLANQMDKDRTDWSIGNKRGDFKPDGRQKVQYENFTKSSKNLRDVVIPKIRSNIEALERKIAGE